MLHLKNTYMYWCSDNLEQMGTRTAGWVDTKPLAIKVGAASYETKSSTIGLIYDHCHRIPNWVRSLWICFFLHNVNCCIAVHRTIKDCTLMIAMGSSFLKLLDVYITYDTYIFYMHVLKYHWHQHGLQTANIKHCIILRSRILSIDITITT